jgi:hypothetical protein
MTTWALYNQSYCMSSQESLRSRVVTTDTFSTLSHSIQLHRTRVRRLLSISLLLLLVLPIVSPLFAATPSEANLPACCRRNGKHHCTMGTIVGTALQQSSSQSPTAQSSTIREKCPYLLTVQAPAHLIFTPDEILASLYTGILSHPAVHAQTEALLKISFDRSHHKRGPPAPLPSFS